MNTRIVDDNAHNNDDEQYMINPMMIIYRYCKLKQSLINDVNMI